MAKYTSKEFSEKVKQLPPEAIPRGTSFQDPERGFITQDTGGVKSTYYPTSTGGQLDLFSREVPVNQREALQDDLAARIDAYNTMNRANLEMDMANAGFVAGPDGKAAQGNQFLADIANQDFIIRKTKINAWEQSIRSNLKEIRNSEKLTDDEKDRMSADVTFKLDDPIFIPKRTRQKPVDEVTAAFEALGGQPAVETAPLASTPAQPTITTPKSGGYSYDESTGEYTFIDPQTGNIKRSKQPPARQTLNPTTPIDTLSQLREQIQTGKKGRESEKTAKETLKKFTKQTEESTIDDINRAAGYVISKPSSSLAIPLAGGMAKTGAQKIAEVEGLTLKDAPKLSALTEEELAEVKSILYSGNQDAVRQVIKMIKARK